LTKIVKKRKISSNNFINNVLSLFKCFKNIFASLVKSNKLFLSGTEGKEKNLPEKKLLSNLNKKILTKNSKNVLLAQEKHLLK